MKSIWNWGNEIGNLFHWSRVLGDFVNQTYCIKHAVGDKEFQCFSGSTIVHNLKIAFSRQQSLFFLSNKKSYKHLTQYPNAQETGFTYSFSPSLTWVPPYSGRRTVSPSLTETGINFPSLSLDPGPTATTLPELSWNQPGMLVIFRSTRPKQ